MATTQPIVTCLWFDTQAEEAARYYTGIFKNSKIGNISRYTEAGREVHGRPAGTVMTVEFELNGQPFTALNGGPVFKFSEAVSLQVNANNLFNTIQWTSIDTNFNSGTFGQVTRFAGMRTITLNARVRF